MNWRVGVDVRAFPRAGRPSVGVQDRDQAAGGIDQWSPVSRYTLDTKERMDVPPTRSSGVNRKWRPAPLKGIDREPCAGFEPHSDSRWWPFFLLPFSIPPTHEEDWRQVAWEANGSIRQFRIGWFSSDIFSTIGLNVIFKGNEIYLLDVVVVALKTSVWDKNKSANEKKQTFFDMRRKGWSWIDRKWLLIRSARMAHKVVSQSSPLIL